MLPCEHGDEAPRTTHSWTSVVDSVIRSDPKREKAIQSLMRQQRSELNTMFGGWLEKLEAMRVDQARREELFIDRASRSCATTTFGNGQLTQFEEMPPELPTHCASCARPYVHNTKALPFAVREGVASHDDAGTVNGSSEPLSCWKSLSAVHSTNSSQSIAQPPPDDKPVEFAPPFSAPASVVPTSLEPECKASLPFSKHVTPPDVQPMPALDGMTALVPGSVSVDADLVSGTLNPDGDLALETSPEAGKEEQRAAPSQSFCKKKFINKVESSISLGIQETATKARRGTLIKVKDPFTKRCTELNLPEELPGPLGVLQSMLRSFTKSMPFTFVCSMMIFLNAFYIGYHEELQLNAEVDPHFDQGSFYKATQSYSEAFFCAFFTIELLLRFIVEPVTFALGQDMSWHMFDLALVLNCVVEYVLARTGGKIPNLTVVRILRLCRMFRILRVLRVMRIFRTLRLMVSSIVASMVSLLWVFLLLIFAIYVWAILFMHAVYELAENTPDHELAEKLESGLLGVLVEDFGTIVDASITLFMVISGGRDWSEVYEPLKSLSSEYGYLFIAYVFFVMFGMVNVVTGAFVDILQQVSKRDRDIVIEEEMKRATAYIEGVKQVFEDADADMSNTLSWEELTAHMKDERMQAYLSSLEIEAAQARALFVLLDVDESGEVNLDEFVKGCMRLKGTAKSMDVNMLLYENEKILHQFTTFRDFAENQFALIIDCLNGLNNEAITPSPRPIENSSRRSSRGKMASAYSSRLEAATEALSRLSGNLGDGGMELS